MRQFLEWTLESIRAENSDFSWMEEFRYDWTPLMGSLLSKLMAGQSVLLLADERREWFLEYIAYSVNDPRKGRPFVPFFRLDSLVADRSLLERSESVELIEDMLNISFPLGYIVWYIGEGDHYLSRFASRRDDAFLWLMDEQMPGAFTLRGGDPLLDMKLIQLYRLFDKSMEAVMFGEIELD